MSKCLRVGCHRPRAHPDPHGLGLCTYHYQQLHQGTIGRDHNPRSRETPVEEAQALIDQVRHPGETNRALARRLGIPKDTIYHVCRRTWPVLRSATWETLQEACAQARYLDQTVAHHPHTGHEQAQ